MIFLYSAGIDAIRLSVASLSRLVGACSSFEYQARQLGK
jgi:hypothetical protein